MRITRLIELLLMLSLASPVCASLIDEPDASDRLATRATALSAYGDFLHEFPAKGKKRDEKAQVQHKAIRDFAKTCHPLVADKLLKVASRAKSDEIRTSALVAIATMKVMPAYAGEQLVAALRVRKIRKDSTSVLAIMQGFVALSYVPSPKVWKDLFKHSDVAVQKMAIASIAKLGDERMLEALVSKLAVCDKAEAGGGTGGAAGGGTGGTAGRGTGVGGRGSRRFMGMTRLRASLTKALESMTGQEFDRAAEVRAWIESNPKKLRELSSQLSKVLAKQTFFLRQAKAWAKDKK